MPDITICPTCGSDKIKKVQRDLAREFQGQSYTVPALEFYECPNCGERFYDREAVQKMQACSPAFAKPQTQRARAKARVPITAGARAAA
ncbi:MAG: YgiT-type zinc finger protein [Chloroflexi bacterium]|nr:YgiT-type zinc finger protein [Chloroflexota bacterium]